MPIRLLDEVLAVARGFGGNWIRAWVLAGIVPHRPDSERVLPLGEILAAARGIEEGSARAEALAAIVPNCPEAERDIPSLDSSPDTTALIVSRRELQP